MKRSEALRLREIVELAMSGQTIDDATASEGVQLFPRLKQKGELIKAGTRIRWGDTLKRAAADLWDTAENNPDAAPTLWEDIQYRKGYRVIPATITAALAFGLNECGWFGDVLYKSKRAGNVFTPAQTPEWWEVVEE